MRSNCFSLSWLLNVTGRSPVSALKTLPPSACVSFSVISRPSGATTSAPAINAWPGCVASSIISPNRYPRRVLKLRKLLRYLGGNPRPPVFLTLNVMSSRHYSPDRRHTQGPRCETARCYCSFTTPEPAFRRQQTSRSITWFSNHSHGFCCTEKQTSGEAAHCGRKPCNCFNNSLMDELSVRSSQLHMVAL